MLKTLTIQSFKAISSQVTIPLREFNVIIGRNGSGKSSALEALSWLSECISSGATEATKPFRRIEDLIYRGCENFHLNLSFDPQDLSVGPLVEFAIDVTKKGGRPAISSEFLRYGSEHQWTDRIITDEDGRKYELSLTGKISKTDRELIRKRAKGNPTDQPLVNILYLLDSFEAQEFAAFSNDDELVLKLVDPKADRGGELLRDALERLVTLRLSPKEIGSFSDADTGAASKKLLDEQGLGVARLLSALDEETRNILIEKVSFITGRPQGVHTHEPDGPADRRYFGFNETIGSRPSTWCKIVYRRGGIVQAASDGICANSTALFWELSSAMASTCM